MARKPGYRGVLVLDGVTRLGVTNFNFNATRDNPDATGMDSGGARQRVSGLYTATFSCDAHVDDGGVGGLPKDVRDSDDPINFEVQLDNGPVYQYTGTCRLSATEAGVDLEGTVTYRIEAEVEGDWTES